VQQESHQALPIFFGKFPDLIMEIYKLSHIWTLMRKPDDRNAIFVLIRSHF
jgi:hypothetical protein